MSEVLPSLIVLKFMYLLDSPKLLAIQKRKINNIINIKSNIVDLKESLKNLIEYLHIHHDVMPYVLIDEYDTPLYESYIHDYRNEMVDLLQGLLGSGLKNCTSLRQVIVTGILWVGKESLFSAFNNPETFSVLDVEYRQHFGFADSEIERLFTIANLNTTMEDIKEWYNGYLIGQEVVYNPWSIMECIRKRGGLGAYWVNTTESGLIRRMIIGATVKTKQLINQLLQNKTIDISVIENLSYRQIKTMERKSTTLWTLLLMSGYLTATETKLVNDLMVCTCRIPNKEIKSLFANIIKSWLSGDDDPLWYYDFINQLLAGNVDAFMGKLRTLIQTRFALRDLRKDYHESLYQGFMSGLFACISNELYDIESQGDSGDGYFDLAIIPKDTEQLLILFEFKAVKNVTDESNQSYVDREATAAIQQINATGYTEKFIQKGYENILQIGIAFSSKYVGISTERNRREEFNDVEEII